jgi:hypothetical protein
VARGRPVRRYSTRSTPVQCRARAAARRKLGRRRVRTERSSGRCPDESSGRRHPTGRRTQHSGASTPRARARAAAPRWRSNDATTASGSRGRRWISSIALAGHVKNEPRGTRRKTQHGEGIVIERPRSDRSHRRSDPDTSSLRIYPHDDCSSASSERFATFDELALVADPLAAAEVVGFGSVI